jgi:hypothetical protein
MIVFWLSKAVAAKSLCCSTGRKKKEVSDIAPAVAYRFLFYLTK